MKTLSSPSSTLPAAIAQTILKQFVVTQVSVDHRITLIFTAATCHLPLVSVFALPFCCILDYNIHGVKSTSM